MAYTLSRFDYSSKVSIDTFASVMDAVAWLHADGYDYVQAEEDDDYPQHWDIFASKGLQCDIFTVEPVSQTQPTAPRGWDKVEGGPTND